MMSHEVIFELEYNLNRRQRLVPHLFLWLPYMPLIGGALVMEPIWAQKHPWSIPFVLIGLLVFKGFFVGIWFVIKRPYLHVDLVIEEEAIVAMVAGVQTSVSLTGIINVGKIGGGAWTIYHDNGVVINIPASAMTE